MIIVYIINDNRLLIFYWMCIQDYDCVLGFNLIFELIDNEWFILVYHKRKCEIIFFFITLMYIVYYLSSL